MSMPLQKPGQSKQDYGTPRELIRAVESRFGPLVWDLAASVENAKAPNFITKEQDTFTVAWHKLAGWQWLNPEFGQEEHPCQIVCTKKRCVKRGYHCEAYTPGMAQFVEKCSVESQLGARILLLTPLTSADWYRTFIEPYAYQIPLSPRFAFEGESDPYPKDLTLSVFAYGMTGHRSWRWK